MSSIFETIDFNKLLAEEDKKYIGMYMRKAVQMLEQNQVILAIDDLEQALSHSKLLKRHLEKAQIEQTPTTQKEDEIIKGLELV